MNQDSVLYYGLRPIFSGTPEETVAWLEKYPHTAELDVRIGETAKIVSVPEYLAG